MKRLIFVGFVLSACSPSSDPPLSRIGQLADTLQPELVSVRRDIHMHPELSGAEARTAQVVADQLAPLGLEVRTGVGGHGVVAILRTGRPGPVVGYRADMDAMPMQEPDGRPYGSTVPGVFHVCGHDLHTAIGLGVASVLSSQRANLRGTVVFFFQPAEETLQGAAAMLADGALADPRPDVVYAVHSWPFPVGEMAHPTAFAGLDKFSLHPPATAVNDLIQALAPLNTATIPSTPEQIAEVLTELETPGSPLGTSVFLRAGYDAQHGVFMGSVKAADDSLYQPLRQRIRDAIDGVIGAGNDDVAFVDPIFPAMRPNAAVDADAAPMLARSVGADKLHTLAATWPLNGEDFALFEQAVPGAMFLLGVANQASGISGVPHSPSFDADEEAIRVGVRTLSAVIWQRLWQ